MRMGTFLLGGLVGAAAVMYINRNSPMMREKAQRMHNPFEQSNPYYGHSHHAESRDHQHKEQYQAERHHAGHQLDDYGNDSYMQ